MACRRAAIVDLSSGGSQSSDEHRSALLRHLDVVNQTAQQSTTKLRCKSCKHVMTGVGERIAAHFAQVSGRSVVICSEPPQQAKEVGEKFLREPANLKLVAKDYDARPFIAWDPDSVESDGFLGDEKEMGRSDSDDDVGFDV